MSKKTVKDLEKDFNNIKEQFQTLKINFDTLADKYEDLETKYKECMSMSKQRSNYKCNKCDKEFQSHRELKGHTRIQHSSIGQFQCDVCDKLFDEEWKFNAHTKSHKLFPCEHCDKKFKYQETRSRHIKATHEHIKLYCHFFNNNVECPFNEQCIFLHEESEQCKYGVACERENCMYKHDENDDENVDEYSVNIDEEENEENKENDGEDGNESANTTFVNPFLEASETFKCELCDFKARSEGGLRSHKRTCPNNKHPCSSSRCNEAFETKKMLKNHMYHAH